MSRVGWDCCVAEREETEPTSPRAGDSGSGSEFSHQSSDRGSSLRAHITLTLCINNGSTSVWGELKWRESAITFDLWILAIFPREGVKEEVEDRGPLAVTAASPARPASLNLATPGSLVWANLHLTRQGLRLRVTWPHFPVSYETMCLFGLSLVCL